MVADITALVVLVLSFLHGLSKGFIKMISRTLIFAVSLVVMYVGFTPTYNALQDFKPYIRLETTISSNIKSYITDHVDNQYSTTKEAINSLKFPKPINKFLNNYCENMTSVIVDDVSVIVTSAVTKLFMRIIVGFVLFITLLVGLFILSHVLNLLGNLPIIHGTNRLLGGLFGAINGLFMLYIACFIIMVLPFKDTIWFQQYLDGSLFKTYIYDNNIFSYLVNLITF